ncbi:MAG TPA: hypothetical protein VFS49_09985 [Croceibacterium sp.]|nr:hypothetical protein [Croceibacterium sp.]
MSPAEEPVTGSVVFSLIDGKVWAGWLGANGSVMLGSSAEVTYMMRDFLAQCDFAERLASRTSSAG